MAPRHTPADRSTAPTARSAEVRISTFCAGSGCVGVAPTGDGVAVVDTKLGDGPTLRFTHEEWAAFVAGVKNGEFDLD